MVKIEQGKYYRMRNGHKIGPMERGDGVWHGEDHLCPAYRAYFDGGKWVGLDCSLDLIEEWTDSPVRTVTRKEIVPGVYGMVIVKNGQNGNAVDIWFNGSDVTGMSHWFTAPELRAAAQTLTELADALDDGA